MQICLVVGDEMLEPESWSIGSIYRMVFRFSAGSVTRRNWLRVGLATVKVAGIFLFGLCALQLKHVNEQKRIKASGKGIGDLIIWMTRASQPGFAKHIGQHV